MHELSIAHSLVELAEAAVGVEGARAVKSLNLAVGALSCVSPDALEYCFELASQGSRLEGARLSFHRLPVVIRCAPCGRDVELPGIQSFHCPSCDTPSSDVRQGRELEIVSLEIETDEPEIAVSSPTPAESDKPQTDEDSPKRAVFV
ncbi:MAG: hydrogenase maturation nickel metallochaperone HypA [Acidobacteriota bacterium]